jgi:Caspase domain
MSREVSATQSGTPFNLKFRFEPRSRLFGLIVGIDKYQSGGIRNLQGCKADAQSMVDLLSRKFHIRSSHFRCLADERATRSAIIDGFEHHLIENNNIERGDAILIFYAGHGSRATAPSRWAADERKVETICPHDERTRDCNGKEIFGIPDRTIGGLLRKLCSFKGSNIVRMTCRPIFVSS